MAKAKSTCPLCGTLLTVSSGTARKFLTLSVRDVTIFEHLSSSVCVLGRSTSFTKTALQVFDFLTALMKYQTFGGVTTDFPVPGAKRWNQGWMSSDLNVPFFFYQ